MKKFLIFILVFLFSINFSKAEIYSFPLFRNEELLKVYRFQNRDYILSKNNNLVTLRIFENNRLFNIKNIFISDNFLDVYFIEDNEELKISLITYLLTEFKIKILDENFNILREINFSLPDNYQLSKLKYLSDQNKLFFIFSGLNNFYITTVSVDNYFVNERILNISSEEKLFDLIFNNFYTLIINKKTNYYKIYILNRNLELVNQFELNSNFEFFDGTTIGNTFYLCGKNDLNQFYLIKIFNNVSDSRVFPEIKINNKLYCRYTEGDINDLFIVYDDQYFKIKFLNNNSELLTNISNLFEIKEIKFPESEIFNGNIKLIGKNSYRVYFNRLNLFNYNSEIKSFSGFNYIDNYYDQIADKILILMQRNYLGKIYSEF